MRGLPGLAATRLRSLRSAFSSILISCCANTLPPARLPRKTHAFVPCGHRALARQVGCLLAIDTASCIDHVRELLGCSDSTLTLQWRQPCLEAC